MPPAPLPGNDVEGDVLELFFVLYEPLRAHFAAAAEGLGLTPIQAKVLRTLTDPMSQRSISEQLACDASYVTLLIDQLEQAGLVVRRPAPTDRRIKHVSLTPKGKLVRRNFETELHRNVPGVASLSDVQVKSLRRTLGKMYKSLDL